MSWAERAPERVSGVSCVSTSRFPVWNSGPPPERGHLMVSSQGSEVTNGDEDPAIIRGRVQTGGGVTADIEWSTTDAGKPVSQPELRRPIESAQELPSK